MVVSSANLFVSASGVELCVKMMAMEIGFRVRRPAVAAQVAGAF